MKVVLDANILVSLLLTHGSTLTQIIKAWEKEWITPIVTDEILTEIKQVLGRLIIGRVIKEKEAAALFSRLEKDAIKISSLSVVSVSTNKKDNRYLAAAKDGDAEYLITGDKKHLLFLKRFGSTKIISPREFLEVLRYLGKKN